jgi:hypothetical protein
MKSIKILSVLLLFCAHAMAQISSLNLFVHLPSAIVQDSLNNRASEKQVKELKRYSNVYGTDALSRWCSFNKAGKVEREYIYVNNRVVKHYYTYSGDTTLIRTLLPDLSYKGGGGTILTLEKRNSKGQTLSFYKEKLKNEQDTLKTPEEGGSYVYKNGLPVTTLTYSLDEEDITYDSYGYVTRIQSKEKNETYRRVYESNRLRESYYSRDNEPEVFLERFKFNADGTLSEFTINEWGDTLTFSYTYDEAKRILLETTDCATIKYTYNNEGVLIKEEAKGCEAYVTDYVYNDRGLPISIVKKESYAAEPVTETFTYTYWE